MPPSIHFIPPLQRTVRLARIGLLALLIFVSKGTLANAQTISDPSNSPTPFANLVPSSARLFVSVQRLGDVDDALRRAHAWRLAPLLAGSQLDSPDKFDLRAALTRFLGPNLSVDVDLLLDAEIGMAARSLNDLDRPVWFVRIPSEKVLDRWFPPNQRDRDTTSGTVRFLSTKTGVLVCARGGIVAMSRFSGQDSLLREVMHLMADQDTGSVGGSATYQELTAHLPSSPLAVVFLQNKPALESGKELASPWLPELGDSVFGLFEGDGRLDLAIRATMATPTPRPALSPHAVERLLRLPQSTLFATATTIDFARAFDAETIKALPRTIGRCLTLLSGIGDVENPSPTDTPPFGPHVLLVWGQNISDRGLTPNVALMVECQNDSIARSIVRPVVERLIRLASLLDPQGTAGGLTINKHSYLGMSIQHVPLLSYAEKSRIPFAKLLKGADPAWTVWDGWLILALTRDHLERILDAHYGLIPSLATVRDVRSLRESPGGRTAVSVVQPGIASDVLGQWLASWETGSPSLLSPSSWSVKLDPSTSAPLGIGMHVTQEPGVVHVARVYPNTLATGAIEPGDRILGIDGQLLSLDSPNQDLRERWAQMGDATVRVLRVLRGETTIDVSLTISTEKKEQWPGLALDPVDAIRELASLGQALEFAGFAAHVTDDKHYSAQFTLRFATNRSANAERKAQTRE